VSSLVSFLLFFCFKETTKSHKQTYEKIKRVDFAFPAHFSDDAKSLLLQLLVREPSARLPLAKVVDHPWIVKNAGKASDF
jgi:aurora kinase